MLATLRNALKVKDLRQRLFFTFHDAAGDPSWIPAALPGR